jgi:hypothetical protein
MKKITRSIIIFSVFVFVNACKKNSDSEPAFVATGYWRGHLPVDFHTIVGLVNHADGTSRYYLMAGVDTASAAVKYDGTYTAKSGFFHAEYHLDSTGYGDTLSLETTSTSANTMSGLIVEHGISGTTHFAAAYNFELIKQP